MGKKAEVRVGEGLYVPKISVILTVYQGEEFLAKCLESLLAQTLEEIEIICIDDGSTDKSGEILNSFSEKDSRFEILHQKNQGAGAGRNRGLQKATGVYTIFLDCDDYFESTLLEELYKAVEKENADVGICRSCCFDHNNEKKLPSEWMRKDKFLKGKKVFSPLDVKEYLFQFTYGWAWDKLFRSAFLREHGFAFPELRNSEDLVFVYAALAVSKKIVVIDSVLVNYRMNQTNSVSQNRNTLPLAPWEGICLLEKELKSRMVYQDFEQSFLNWEMEFLIWNVSNLSEKSIQKKEFQRLKLCVFPSFIFEQKKSTYYYNKFFFMKYLLIRYGNWCLFYTTLKMYHWLKSLHNAMVIRKGEQ